MQMKKNLIKKVAKEQILIALGTLIFALGVNIFLAPNKISGGGTLAISTVLLHLFGVHMSVTNLVINAILYILGYKFLGKYIVFKNLTGTLYVSFFLEITRNVEIYSSDLFIATIMGGILIGIGVGTTIKAEGSTGGTDFAGLIIRKFLPHIPVAYTILFLDITGVVLSAIIFKSFTVAFYSGLALFIGAKITDYIIAFGDNAKAVNIFSDKIDEVYEYVKERFDRTATAVYCKGMYSGEEKMMLYCIVSPKELPIIVSSIKRIDNRAFVVVSEVKEVLGEGFKVL